MDGCRKVQLCIQLKKSHRNIVRWLLFLFVIVVVGAVVSSTAMPKRRIVKSQTFQGHNCACNKANNETYCNIYLTQSVYKYVWMCVVTMFASRRFLSRCNIPIERHTISDDLHSDQIKLVDLVDGYFKVSHLENPSISSGIEDVHKHPI